MRIDVSAKGMDLTDTIKQHAQEKAGKLPRYYDGVQSIEVHIETRKNDQFFAELRVDVEKHDTFVSHDELGDIYASIDSAADKMVRQLTDFKEKLKNSNR